MEFEKMVYRALIIVLLTVSFLSAIFFFVPFAMSGYEGVIESDGIILAAMYGISVLGLVLLNLSKKN